MAVDTRVPKAAPAPAKKRASSVALKIFMAVTGILLVLFLYLHMIGNLKIFFGATTFDHYAHWLQAEVDLLRSHNLQTCEALMAGEDITRMATVAKLKAGRLIREVADWCLQFHGGAGYLEETWTARMLRDVRLTSIGAGADEVMLQVLARLDGLPA